MKTFNRFHYHFTVILLCGVHLKNLISENNRSLEQKMTVMNSSDFICEIYAFIYSIFALELSSNALATIQNVLATP